jgi:hypothetical protein
MQKPSVNLVLGLAALCFGLFAIFVWVPLDSGSGIVIKSRGKFKVGDALAPTVAFSLLCIAGLMVIFEQRRGATSPKINPKSHVFALLFLGIFAVSILLMRWTGPIIVHLLGVGADQGIGYRELRDTAPWKYLGYVTGGTVLITATITLASRVFKPRFLLIGFGMACLMAAIYDLPFEDLLLPPNGDV